MFQDEQTRKAQAAETCSTRTDREIREVVEALKAKDEECKKLEEEMRTLREAKDKEIGETQTRVEFLEGCLKQKDGEISYWNVEVRKLRVDLEEKCARVSDLEKCLKTKNDEAEDLVVSLMDREDELNELENRLSSKCDEARLLQCQLSESLTQRHKEVGVLCLMKAKDAGTILQVTILMCMCLTFAELTWFLLFVA